MNNSKLIRVLRTFDKREFKQFGKFIASPFFSSGRNIIPLYDVLKKYYPHFDSGDLSKETILDELSEKDHKISSSVLKTQMSEMYKLAEHYLTLQKAGIHTGLDTFFFAGNCLNRGLYEIGESKMKNTLRKLEKKGIGHWFYLNFFYAGAIAKTIHEIRGSYSKSIPLYNHDSEVLLHQFLCNASHYISSIVELEREFNFDSGSNLLFNFMKNTDFEKLLDELKNKNNNCSIASRIYIFLILTYIKFPDKDINSYYELKEGLFKNIEIFDTFEKGFFSHTIYWLVENMAKGERYTEFTKETFEIIKFRLQNNLYKRTPKDPFAVSAFCSFFYVGFKLKKKSWLQNFKKKYLKELPEQERDSCDAWTGIFIDFLERDYIKCLNRINFFKNFILIYTYPVKRLQLMVFYELGYINEAFYAIDAFKSFLRQNKNVTGDFLESNTSFIKFYTELLKHKSREKELNIKKLRIDVKNSVTDNQEWLIEKIDEMI